MNPKKKLKIVFAESILSAAGLGFCVPIMTVFWNSIGMDQTLIGLAQMMFTVTIMLSDIPMGYIADRYSRKKLNIIGGFGAALAFVIYAFSRNFWVVVLAEVMFGIFLGMTNGVDDAFVKFYSDKIDPTGEAFKKNNARLKMYHYIGLLAAIIIGMAISKISLRLSLGASSVPFVIAGILSFFIDDIGEKTEKTMLVSVGEVLKNKKVKWLVFAYAVSREVTHPVIWVFTPLLIAAGVPVYLVGIGWIFNYIFSTLGTILAGKTLKFSPAARAVTPVLIAAAGMLPIIANLNIVTVWLFALVGLAQGYSVIGLSPIIQQETKDEYQTTAISIATTAARLLYIPAVVISNWAGSFNPQYTLITTLLMFIPLAALACWKLRR